MMMMHSLSEETDYLKGTPIKMQQQQLKNLHQKDMWSWHKALQQDHISFGTQNKPDNGSHFPT